MSSNGKSSGGQKRTIEYGCGFIIAGHPNEVNQKHKRHIRVCSVCVNSKKTKTLPDFDKDMGCKNGWKGMTPKGTPVKEQVILGFINGECKGFITVEGNSIEERNENVDKKNYKNKEEEEIEKILQYLNAKSP